MVRFISMAGLCALACASVDAQQPAARPAPTGVDYPLAVQCAAYGAALAEIVGEKDPAAGSFRGYETAYRAFAVQLAAGRSFAADRPDVDIAATQANLLESFRYVPGASGRADLIEAYRKQFVVCTEQAGL
jgi:hypothetical protein